MTPNAVAKDILKSARIAVGTEYENLNAEQLAAVVGEAAEAFWRKHNRPLAAGNMRFVRKRYALLQYRASKV